jgi:hypothetical protein
MIALHSAVLDSITQHMSSRTGHAQYIMEVAERGLLGGIGGVLRRPSAHHELVVVLRACWEVSETVASTVQAPMVLRQQTGTAPPHAMHFVRLASRGSPAPKRGPHCQGRAYYLRAACVLPSTERVARALLLLTLAACNINAQGEADPCTGTFGTHGVSGIRAGYD